MAKPAKKKGIPVKRRPQSKEYPIISSEVKASIEAITIRAHLASNKDYSLEVDLNDNVMYDVKLYYDNSTEPALALSNLSVDGWDLILNSSDSDFEDVISLMRVFRNEYCKTINEFNK